MRPYRLFALLLAILFVFPAAVNAAERDKQNPVVKCERPAAEYLKEAEALQKEGVFRNRSGSYTAFDAWTLAARTSLELYKVCSALERGDR